MSKHLNKIYSGLYGLDSISEYLQYKADCFYSVGNDAVSKQLQNISKRLIEIHKDIHEGLTELVDEDLKRLQENVGTIFKTVLDSEKK